MLKRALVLCLALVFVTAVNANPLNWGWVDVTSLPPRGPILSPTEGPENIGEASAPASPTPGECYYYMIDDGENSDNNGSANSHFDPEGGSAGSYRGQAWTRWVGLNDMKADCDAAFGVGQWTIKRIWFAFDEASFPWADTGGYLSAAEVSGLNNQSPVADWGDSTSITQTQVTNGIPVGYHGHYMTATAGGSTNQSWLMYDGTSGPAVPAGSNAFAQIACGSGEDMVIPAADSFTMYLAPLNDYNGGQGWDVALSFDGFDAGTFGFAPLMVFEVCMRNTSCTSNSIPVAEASSCNNVPVATVAGTTCDFTLYASDADLGDTLTFNLTSPGPLGGQLVPNPSDPNPHTDGNGNWWLNVRYTIPAGVRGVDILSFNVDDGSNPSGSADITVVIRGDAVQNTVALGYNLSDGLDTLKLITGEIGANGGMSASCSPSGSAVVDVVGCQGYIQSVEFDNYICSHDPNGTLLGLNYGAEGEGGFLYAIQTSASCGDTGPTELFAFDGSVGGSVTRVTSLAVNPGNTKLCVWGWDTSTMWIFDYSGSPAAPAVSFDKTISVPMFGTQSVGTEWLDDTTLMVTTYECTVLLFDVTTGSQIGTWYMPMDYTCMGAQVGEITYNAEISPYVYVMFGAYSSITYNSLIVFDTSGNVVPQCNGTLSFTEYNPGDGGATWREAGMDCYGNLFISTYASEVYYLANAGDPSTLCGGYESMILWRSCDSFAAYTGMDIAHCGACSTTPPMAQDVSCSSEGTCHSIPATPACCTITLKATDVDGDITAFEIDNPGTNGGTLTLVGGPVYDAVAEVWNQQADYCSADAFCGKECFTYRATDGDSYSNDAAACINSRSAVRHGTVAFAGSLADSAETMRLYQGCHFASGGTSGHEEVIDCLTYAQSVEFDNYNGVAHNPVGNLLALNFGTTAGGGMLYVYPTHSDCGCDESCTTIYNWDGITGGNLSRVSGLSVSPDNTKIAAYGYDTQTIYVLNYNVGAGVGCGGDDAAGVSYYNNYVVPAAGNNSLATGWLDNDTMLWVDQAGNFNTIELSDGSLTLRTPCPRAGVANISLVDIEYNAEKSPYIVVSIGEYDSGSSTETNTLYFVDPTTWSVVNQGGANTGYTDHSNSGTFREIAWDCCGNLFFTTIVDYEDLVNIRLIPQAVDVANISDDSSVVWNEMDEDQAATNYSGIDVALGDDEQSGWCCSMQGDLNDDGVLNGADMQSFINCWLNYAPNAAGPGCCCADFDKSGTVDQDDVDAFVNALLN